MSQEDKQYCDHHFEFVKHLGTTERALKDIDEKITKLFGLIEKRGEKDNKQDAEIGNLSGFIKAYIFHITIALSLLSIAVKLWSR